MFSCFVLFYTAALRLAVFSLCRSLSFFLFFLTFRFPAHRLLLIASYLHLGRDENSDIHTPREDDVNDLFISKSKKKKKKE